MRHICEQHAITAAFCGTPMPYPMPLPPPPPPPYALPFPTNTSTPLFPGGSCSGSQVWCPTCTGKQACEPAPMNLSNGERLVGFRIPALMRLKGTPVVIAAVEARKYTINGKCRAVCSLSRLSQSSERSRADFGPKAIAIRRSSDLGHTCGSSPLPGAGTPQC